MVIIEQGPTSFGAYVPDLPGCIAVGDTQDAVLQLIQEAIEFHVEGLIERGDPVPSPHSWVAPVAVQPESRSDERSAVTFSRPLAASPPRFKEPGLPS